MKNLKYYFLSIFLLSATFFLGSFQQNPTTKKGDTSQKPERFGFGRTPTAAEIKALDIDVRPDGQGLPEGEGTVAEGAQIYKMKCAVCHGATGTEGPQDVLVGKVANSNFRFAESVELARQKNIGNYWPYASTIFDYTYRAMPQNLPGSLTPNEVYSLVAFLLFKNEIISEEMVMNQTTLPQVQMPAEKYFVGGIK